MGNVDLAPKAIKQIRLTPLFANAGLAKFNGYANLTVSFPGRYGDVLISTGSVDQTMNYVFAVPAMLEQHTQGKIFCYWQVVNDTDTMLTLWNYTNRDQDLVLTFVYRTGKYDFPLHLAARQSRMLSVASLIRESKPDAHGNIIPSNVQEGMATLEGAGGIGESFDIAADLSIVNVRTGTCKNGCYTCDGVVTIDASDFVSPVALSQQQQQHYNIHLYDGRKLPETTATWSSGNTSIATVTSGALTTGAGGGSTSILAVTPADWYTGVQYICPPTLCPHAPQYRANPPITVSAFNVAYSSYIPVDNVNGPSSCTYLGQYYDLFYKGDGNYNTHRTASSILVSPDAQHYWNFWWGNGETRNYGQGSPVNPPNLSPADDDNIPNDCHLWNAATTSTVGSAFTVSYPYTHQAQVELDGAVTNPLESQVAPITWDMRTLIDTTNPAAPTALLNYNHTCYPSHQITVNGKQIYLYTPSRNDLTYITYCLFFEYGKISGQQGTAIPVPTY